MFEAILFELALVNLFFVFLLKREFNSLRFAISFFIMSISVQAPMLWVFLLMPYLPELAKWVLSMVSILIVCQAMLIINGERKESELDEKAAFPRQIIGAALMCMLIALLNILVIILGSTIISFNSF